MSNLNNSILKLKSIYKAIYDTKMFWFFILFFLFAPPLICLIFIIQFGTNVCFWDQWEIVPLFDKFYTGQLSLSDLLAPHNEHIIFFPRIIMLFIGVITHYNNVAEMLFSWTLLVLICLLLYKIFTVNFGHSKNALIQFIPVVWFVFSLRQFGNLLWGFQIAWFLISFFVLLTLYFIGKSKTIDICFGAAITSGIIASFCSIQGLLVWPTGIFYIIFSTKLKTDYNKKSLIKLISLWLIVSITVFIIYIINSNLTLTVIGASYNKDFYSIFLFVLTVFGNAIGINEISCLIFGILLLVVFSVIGIYLALNRHNIKNNSVLLGLSLIIFVFLFYLMLIIGRSGLGYGQAASSTYSTISILGIIGLYILILGIKFKYEKLKSYLRVIIMLGLIFTYTVVAIYIGPHSRTNKQQLAYYLLTYQDQTDENLNKLYPVHVVRERAPILEEYNLNVFYKQRE